LNLNCKGNITDKQSILLSADVSEADLEKMNFNVFSTSGTEVSTTLFASLRDFDLNKMNAFVDLQNTKIKNPEKEYLLQYLNFRIKNDSLENQMLLKSDLLDLTLKGDYNILDLVKEITDMVEVYKPDLYLLSDSTAMNQGNDTIERSLNIASCVDFELDVKDISPIVELFDLNMDLPDGLSLLGKLNPQDIFSAELSADSFTLNEVIFKGIGLSLSTKQEILMRLITERFVVTYRGIWKIFM
jgi:hypothetical protein